MTLNELLFADFLRNRQTYLEATRFWQDRWNAVDPLTRRDWQTPWFPPVPEPLQDGNPIFTALSPSRRRGLRIIQLDPAEQHVPLQFWTNWFGGQTNPDAVEELVIACTLARDIVPTMQMMIQAWVQHGRVRVAHARTAVQSYQHENSTPVRTSQTPVAA